MSPHETLDPIGDDELFELFAPHRPQAEAFEAGVEQRIAARRERAAGEATEPPVESRLWRRAAALLPIDPSLAAGLGAGAGGKALSLALALPALVLASVFGGFAAGARSLRRSVADARPAQRLPRVRALKLGRSDRAVRTGGRLSEAVQFVTLAAFGVTWLFGGSLAIDLLTLVLVLSMLGLVVSVRGLARVGLLERRDVARLTVGVLSAVFTGCFLWFHNLRLADDVSSLGVGWASSLVLLGMPLCLALAGRRADAALALALVTGAALLLNTPGVTHSSPRALRAELAGLQLDTDDLVRWREAAELHAALSAVGAPLPDLSALRERLQRALRASEDVHPVVWTSAQRMGLIDADGWRALSTQEFERHRLDQLEQHQTLSRTPYYQYAYPMLLATRDVTAELRADLARAVVESWPEVGEHGALERAQACLAELDVLGRGDLVDELAPRVHELLRAYWVSGEGAGLYAKVGGFTSNPAKFRTSFDRDTLVGVELMARFGVPPGIDLELLHSHLRRESVAFPLVFELHGYLRATERAALLRLREEIGLPPRSLLEALLAERLTIATFLIVLLCALAVRLAPALPDPVELERDGAQP